MLRVVLFLVAACAKTSYSHTAALSTRNSQYIASKANEHATIPEDINLNRRLRGAAVITEVAETLESMIEAFNPLRTLKSEVRSEMSSKTKLEQDAMLKEPSFYFRMLKPFSEFRIRACFEVYEIDTLILFGTSPHLLKQYIQNGIPRGILPESVTVLATTGEKLKRFQRQFDIFFNPPTGSKPSKPSRAWPYARGPQVQANFKKIYSSDHIKFLAYAFHHLDDVNILAKLSSSIIYRFVLDNFKECRATIRYGTVEDWYKHPMLNKLLRVHEVCRKFGI
ncbi:hypothetical protein CCR75_002585 [Bremia lactucae]|uniref:RxLR effector protein n=1 Tax=Bremia lactucae TaxID=4779 RepID=A0A976IL76_BRELC|nr:hypothetical protein CCR75_002585 [Bremia lactucae]